MKGRLTIAVWFLILLPILWFGIKAYRNPQAAKKSFAHLTGADTTVAVEKKASPPPLIFQGTNYFTTNGWGEEILGFNGLKFKGTVMTSNLWYSVMFENDSNQVYDCYPRELNPKAVARFTNLFSSIRFMVTPGHEVTTGKIIWVMREVTTNSNDVTSK